MRPACALLSAQRSRSSGSSAAKVAKPSIVRMWAATRTAAGFGRIRASAQRCLNAGLRFSTKAAMPSFWSSSAKEAWNMRRSKWMPSESVVS
jgi:hypothetical protein